jgi:hypothetical protein
MNTDIEERRKRPASTSLRIVTGLLALGIAAITPDLWQDVTDSADKKEAIFLVFSFVFLFVLFSYYSIWGCDPRFLTRIENAINRRLMTLQKNDSDSDDAP